MKDVKVQIKTLTTTNLGAETILVDFGHKIC